MQDDVLDQIEEEILEEQQKMSKVKSAKIEGSDENKEDFVSKNNPDVSTSYKDRLVRVYDELSALNPLDLETQIAEIRSELKIVIEEMEANDARIRANIVNKIDEEMTEDKDFHYVKKTKGMVVKSAHDPIFTPTNIILAVGIVAIMLVGIIILACYK